MACIHSYRGSGSRQHLTLRPLCSDLPTERIPTLAQDFEAWLAQQQEWLLEKVGATRDEPLGIAVMALDRIARMAVNADGVRKYYVARNALENIGAWSEAEY